MKRITFYAVLMIFTFLVYAQSASQVTVFTIPNCSKCAYMINYLKTNNIPYTEITSADPEKGKKLRAALQSTGTYKGGTVYGPTVIINGKTYYSIQDLQSFTASIPSLLAGGDSMPGREQDQNRNQALPNTDSQFIKNITDRHNYYRLNHNTTALKWNASIAEYAQAWADKIAAENRMYHRQPNRYGENIFWMSGGEVNASTPVDRWYDEIKSYNYSKPGFSMATGHFTQVVWAGSTEVGCGKAKSKSGGTYIVCNYNPPGNYTGQFPKNVLPLKSTGGNSDNSGSAETNNNTGPSVGKLTFTNGAKYEGRIINGKMDGAGIYTFANGTQYHGVFSKGKFHGKGTMYYTNGDVFDGEWKEGKQNGYGSYQWKSGSWYRGYFKDGKYEGQGSLYNSKTKKTETGIFRNGKLSG